MSSRQIPKIQKQHSGSRMRLSSGLVRPFKRHLALSVSGVAAEHNFFQDLERGK
jgi:hypothetical protein